MHLRVFFITYFFAYSLVDINLPFFQFLKCLRFSMRKKRFSFSPIGFHFVRDLWIDTATWYSRMIYFSSFFICPWDDFAFIVPITTSCSTKIASNQLFRNQNSINLSFSFQSTLSSLAEKFIRSNLSDSSCATRIENFYRLMPFDFGRPWLQSNIIQSVIFQRAMKNAFDFFISIENQNRKSQIWLEIWTRRRSLGRPGFKYRKVCLSSAPPAFQFSQMIIFFFATVRSFFFCVLLMLRFLARIFSFSPQFVLLRSRALFARCQKNHCSLAPFSLSEERLMSTVWLLARIPLSLLCNSCMTFMWTMFVVRSIPKPTDRANTTTKGERKIHIILASFSLCWTI